MGDQEVMKDWATAPCLGSLERESHGVWCIQEEVQKYAPLDGTLDQATLRGRLHVQTLWSLFIFQLHRLKFLSIETKYQAVHT